MEGDDLFVYTKGIYLYGETSARDCPYEDFCLDEANADAP